mmetsp:Transcript_22292/g.33825  ORF Transcript_22292/g.33825 Transcript_22292/m.33825 type:complete len:633 (+) Transcript_22292:75-1973(+)
MVLTSGPTTPNKSRDKNNIYGLPIHGTPQRTPLSRSRGTPRRTPLSKPQGPLVSPCVDDRYIPNRSNMDGNLINSSIRSTEKRWLELTPQVYERRRQLTLGKMPEERTVLNSPSSSPRETADQAAFRQTMGAVLHDRPLQEFYDQDGGNLAMKKESIHDKQQNSNSVGSLLSIIHPNLKSDVQKVQEKSSADLAYFSVETLEEQVSKNITNYSSSHLTENGPRRLLKFGSSSEAEQDSFKAVDPYVHNHHEVIQRIATTHKFKDNMSFGGDKVSSKLSKRKIPDKPTKVLDAPDIVDDYYLNLISWSKDNILAVAMGPSVYVWNATTGDIGHVVTLRGAGDYVSSVSWSTIPGSTKYLAIGTHSNSIQLWDTEAKRCVRKLHGHSNRVSSLTWNPQKKWLTSGGRDSNILQHDVRCANHLVTKYKGHRQEVCGLQWNDDGHALASGGNENYLCIWDAAMSQRSSSRRRAFQEVIDIVQPRLLLTQHKAAVKALDWCPFNRGLLASGGGSADRTIKFWNTSSNNGTLTNSIDTGSQVCSLVWSKHQRELCSSHGFSENQLILWKYPSMTKVQEFKSHTARVLNMEISPDGRSVVSVGADETLRFWDIFGPPPTKKKENFLLGDFQCPGAQTVR